MTIINKFTFTYFLHAFGIWWLIALVLTTRKRKEKQYFLCDFTMLVKL